MNGWMEYEWIFISLLIFLCVFLKIIYVYAFYVFILKIEERGGGREKVEEVEEEEKLFTRPTF